MLRYGCRAVGLGAVAAMICAAPLSAYGGEEGKGVLCPKRQAKQQMIQEAISEIGLTEGQLSQIEAQRESAEAVRQELREEYHEKRRALKKELSEPEVDEDAVDSVVLDMVELRHSMIRNRVDSVMAIRQILTREQFLELKQRVEEKKKAHTRA